MAAYRVVFGRKGQKVSEVLNEEQQKSFEKRFLSTPDDMAYTSNKKSGHFADHFTFILRGNEVEGFLNFEPEFMRDKRYFAINLIESFAPARTPFRKELPQWSIGRELIAQTIKKTGAKFVVFVYPHDAGQILMGKLKREGLMRLGPHMDSLEAQKKFEPRLPLGKFVKRTPRKMIKARKKPPKRKPRRKPK